MGLGFIHLQCSQKMFEILTPPPTPTSTPRPTTVQIQFTPLPTVTIHMWDMSEFQSTSPLFCPSQCTFSGTFLNFLILLQIFVTNFCCFRSSENSTSFTAASLWCLKQGLFIMPNNI